MPTASAHQVAQHKGQAKSLSPHHCGTNLQDSTLWHYMHSGKFPLWKYMTLRVCISELENVWVLCKWYFDKLYREVLYAWTDQCNTFYFVHKFIYNTKLVERLLKVAYMTWLFQTTSLLTNVCSWFQIKAQSNFAVFGCPVILNLGAGLKNKNVMAHGINALRQATLHIVM